MWYDVGRVDSVAVLSWLIDVYYNVARVTSWPCDELTGILWACLWTISKETVGIELVVSNRQSNVLLTKPRGRLVIVILKVVLCS